MAGGVVGLGAYRQYRESMRRPWLEAVSSPSGATVFLNGRWIGATPLRVEDLEPGTYAVRFEKYGHDPVLCKQELEKPGHQVSVELQPVSAGRLVVEVQPKGAEVLLDGVLVGHTPLTLNSVTTGPHELLVRRTNFQPYMRRLDLKAGETQTFAGVAMQDLILKALQERRRMEPWRISNATELATYLFLTGQQTAAAEMVMQAIDVTVNPPEFPAEMLPDDRANEQRWRGEDQGRLNHMLARMWSWPDKDAAPFRARMEKPDASLKLLAFRLNLHDRGSATQTAQQLLTNQAKDAGTLTSAVHLIVSRQDQIKEHDYGPILSIADRMAQTAYALDRPSGSLAMAEILLVRGNAPEALKYLRESLAQTSPENAWEDRALSAVRMFQALNQKDEAKRTCERLAKSNRPEMRNAAAELLKQLN
jgi:tetratricopeptide (TPR) repeat protein